MATTELGVAYISIVPETKTFTDELEKASKTGGEKFGKDFKESVNKSVKADGGLGKDITDELEKTVKTKLPAIGAVVKEGMQPILNQLSAAATEYSIELGKNLLSGNVQGAVDQLKGSVQGVTDLASKIGGVFGAQNNAITEFGTQAQNRLQEVGDKVNEVLNHSTKMGDAIREAGSKFGTLRDTASDLAGVDFGPGTKFGNSIDHLTKSAPLIADMVDALTSLQNLSDRQRLGSQTPESDLNPPGTSNAEQFKNLLLAWMGGSEAIPGLVPKNVIQAGPAGPPVAATNPLTAPLGGPTTPSGTTPFPLPKSSPGVVGSGAAGPIGPTNQGAFIGGGGSGVPAAVTPSAKSTALPGPGQVKQAVMSTFAAAGYSPADLAKLDYIIMHESHYDIDALNPGTGDFGVFQFNPAAGNVQTYLPDKSLDPWVQARAGLRYIQDHYGGDLNKAYQTKLSTGIYDEGGVLPPGKHWVINDTGQPELVLNADQAAQAGMDPNTPPQDQSSARTKGYTPPVSNVGGVPGTSTISKFLQLGNEAVGGVIDLGAQAAKLGISAAAGAGSFGAGAAAGPAAGIGIDIASSIAKRGVSYGFQMAGIGADALVENLFSPFGGAPRWLGYDYTKFAPSLDPLKQTASGAIQNAMKQQPGGTPHQGTGAPPGPVAPQQMPGQQGVGPPTPGLGKPPENQNDWFSMFGFDEGGWFPANSVGVNMTGRPEAILSPEQWDSMTTTAPGRGGYGTNIEHLHVSDVEALGRELDKRGRLNMMRYSGRP